MNERKEHANFKFIFQQPTKKCIVKITSYFKFIKIQIFTSAKNNILITNSTNQIYIVHINSI